MIPVLDLLLVSSIESLASEKRFFVYFCFFVIYISIYLDPFCGENEPPRFGNDFRTPAVYLLLLVFYFGGVLNEQEASSFHRLGHVPILSAHRESIQGLHAWQCAVQS